VIAHMRYVHVSVKATDVRMSLDVSPIGPQNRSLHLIFALWRDKPRDYGDSCDDEADDDDVHKPHGVVRVMRYRV
jgi:hypothetical protein